MAISTGQVTVGTSRVQIDGTSTSSFRLIIQNMDNTDAIFIGGRDVTITNGLELLKLETLTIDLFPLEELYAVSAKAGHKLSFLRQV